MGREAVSLWNQALSKAGVSWRLSLDETKDVNIGDNRYHILNMPNEKNRSYAGLAQFYADDETGEVIATASNVIIPDIQDILEKTIISYAYKKHKLLHSLRRTNVPYPASIKGSSFLNKRADLSYSIENLHYLLFTNDIHRLLQWKAPKPPQSLDEVHSYFTQLSQSRFIQPKIKIFPDYFENLSPELKNWLRNFKMAYALKEGRFMENESLEQIQNHINRWDMKSFVYEGYSSRLDHTLDIICHDIDNPVLNKTGFKESVRRCVQQIYPMYALGVAVHELGHSIFSLRHNFSASADYSIQDDHNYQLKHLAPYLVYTNAEGLQARVEDRFPSESSSVMDYIKFSDGEQWSPGAYDVSAIQFLFDDFRDEQEKLGFVEKVNHLQGRWFGLNSNGRKRRFKRCSDWDLGRSVYCLKFDFGSEPHEIALNEVKGLFHIMDQYFYNQGHLMSDEEFYASLFRKLWNLMVIYQDWRRHLDRYSRNYFNTTVERLSEKQRGELFYKFNSLLSNNLEEKELLSFYKARNLIYHTLTYLAFLPNRYCVLEKNWSAYEKKRWKPKGSYVLLELSKIIAESALSDEQQTHPLLSCWNSALQEDPHPAVAEYISTYYPHYSLKKEIGHFLYPQDLPLSAPYKEVSGRPLKGTMIIRANAFAALTLTGRFFPVPLDNNTPFLSMMNEKDIQKGVERLLLARMTRGAFYPITEFFKSFSNDDLERLNPEVSATKLFGFPVVRKGKPDRLFRDELIQPSQLTSDYENYPQSRTDHHRKNFNQNFLEEQPLLSLFNYLYLQAYILSGGVSRDSISEKRAEIFEDIRLENSRTSNLLVEKTIQYNKYREFPYLSALYYFELNDFLILPETDVSLDSIGNQILSELAKNSVRLLWTKPYRKSYEGENLYTSSNGPLKGGFGYYLYEYLGNLLSQFQGTRLGRFYFMYAYLLVLGLLDGYEEAIALPNKASSRDLHRKAIRVNSLVQRSVLNLFGFSFCNGPAAFDNFYKNLESNTRMILKAGVKDGQEYQRWVPAGTFQNVKEQVQYRQEFEKWVFEVCASDSVETGKMHQLFLKEGNLLNRLRSVDLNNFVLGSPAIALPSFFQFLWQDRVNLAEERFRNQRLSREVENIENYLAVKGGVSGIHTVINMLFQFTFPPFFEDNRLMKQWIQSNRQILIDIIPKLMLMYSTDRRFVGELMFLTSMIHRYCLNEGGTLQRCHLVIEKVIGHYFRGSDYVSDPQLDFLFSGLFSGRISTMGETIPMRNLITKFPRDYTDRDVSALAFDMEVLSDYLFYERGWDTMSAHIEELEAQKELLFTILPLSNLRILSSYNFALSK